jgi:hypothetical protein
MMVLFRILVMKESLSEASVELNGLTEPSEPDFTDYNMFSLIHIYRVFVGGSLN